MATTPKRSLSRSAARLAAVQALYQQEMESTPVAVLLHEFHLHRLGATIDGVEYADAEVDFFDDVVKGADARREELDTLIAGKLAAGDVHGTPAGQPVVRPWGERSFYCNDPWGNPLCFVDAGTIYAG